MTKFLFQTQPFRSPDDPAASTVPAAGDPSAAPNPPPGGNAGEGGTDKSLIGDKPPAEPVKAEPWDGDIKGLTLPENFEVDEAQGQAFSALAKEAGLSKESAQKFLELGAEQIRKGNEAGVQLWEKTQTEWRKEVQADPLIGDPKEGIKPEVKASIGKLLDTYGSEDLRAVFDLTGAGNNPKMINFLYKVSQGLTEGTTVKGNPPAGPGQAPGSRPGLAEAIYPNLVPKG